jgi:exodeoxyribonuclease VII large subunit
LNTLGRRYPLAEAILAPTPVQGAEAPPGIIAALEALERLVKPDVIIVARGGGSLEDLWAFNDEGVVRAIAASQVPVIAGIGHETDFTLSDFAADLRASHTYGRAGHPNLAAPDLDDRIQSLARAATTVLDDQRWEMNNLMNRLSLVSPQSRLRSDQQRLDEFSHRLETALAHRMELERTRLNSLSQHLDSLNPVAILRRGFAIVSREDGERIFSTRQVKSGDPIKVQVSDGDFSAKTN